jgi:hypothetical protein
MAEIRKRSDKRCDRKVGGLASIIGSINGIGTCRCK